MRKSIKVVLLIAIIVASVGSLYAYSYFYRPRKPLIGVLTVYGYLISLEDDQLYLNAITYALRNETIKGVVVIVDSPGGYASISEDLYSNLRNLDKVKPVVVLVQGLAASGGYMTALGGRYIIAEPSSFVGNIGVIVSSPSIVVPSERFYDTGPFKFTGFSIKEFPMMVRDALENFLRDVNESRRSRLKASMQELSLGKLYLGSQALKLGLVDELGSLSTALKRVSEFANIKEYGVVDLLKAVERKNSTLIGYELWRNSTMLSIGALRKYSKSPIGIYYLSPYFLADYLRGNKPPQLLYANKIEGDLRNAVLVDTSHKNYFNPLLYGELFGKIVESGYRISFVGIYDNLTALLSKRPKALIIFTPLIEYSDKEVNAIKEYLRNGGKLILLYDTSLASAIAMNELSQNFGIYFSEGYLYNVKKNFWIYRNIYVSIFNNSTLFKNVTRLVLFTATAIYTNATSLARASATLSLTEKSGNYTVIAMSKNVLVIADQTFLEDPYLYAEDDYEFFNNLVEYITGSG